VLKTANEMNNKKIKKITIKNYIKLFAFLSGLAVFLIILIIIIARMFSDYEPTEKEIIGRPEMISLGKSTTTINNSFFGILEYGDFINKDDDPMHSEIPQRINLYEFQKYGVDAHVLLQKIPTEMKWRKKVGGTWLFDSKNQLVIDNATDIPISIMVDSTLLPTLDLYSHAIIIFETETFHHLRITNVGSSGNDTTLQLYVSSVDMGFTGKRIGYYIYNHKGANSYDIHYVRYNPEK